MISRREWIATALAAVPALAIDRPKDVRPKGVLIDSHVHLFAGDPVRFPYNPDSYTPKPEPVEQYVKFAVEAKLNHVVIVHPEPYQDDHRYLEYCFAHEPFQGFFKGTCLFDPIDPKTPQRIKALMERNPNRIVALRIHEIHKPGTPPSTTGAIRNRDLRNPQMTVTWRAVQQLGLAIQLHLIPYYAPQVRELVEKFPDVPVIFDHMARAGQGTPAEYDQILGLAKFPRVYMKFAGIGMSSKQQYPFLDTKPIVKRAYDTYGPDRMIWGDLGKSMPEFEKAVELFNIMFDFAPEPDKAKIRGLTAQKLFAFS